MTTPFARYSRAQASNMNPTVVNPSPEDLQAAYAIEREADLDAPDLVIRDRARRRASSMSHGAPVAMRDRMVDLLVQRRADELLAADRERYAAAERSHVVPYGSSQADRRAAAVAVAKLAGERLSHPAARDLALVQLAREKPHLVGHLAAVPATGAEAAPVRSGARAEAPPTLGAEEWVRVHAARFGARSPEAIARLRELAVMKPHHRDQAVRVIERELGIKGVTK